MSQLNFSRNLFLEKEELERFQLFLQEGVANKLFLRNTSTWGIVDDRSLSGGSFLIEAGINPGTVKISADSYAVNNLSQLIVQKAIDNIDVPADGLYYWMKISRKVSKLEEGTVTVDLNGTLTGTGTLFTDVLRGSATLQVPTKIKFYKAGGAVNSDIYEVVNVGNDDTALLTGSFTPEGGLKYIVIGTYTLGETLTVTQEEGLYDYDATDIEYIVETVVDTEPVGKDPNVEFYVARVVNHAGVVTIVDKRTEYWTFYLEGALLAANNLSELTDIVIAAANLGVYTKAEVDNKFVRGQGVLGIVNPINGWITTGSQTLYWKNIDLSIHLSGFVNDLGASNAVAFNLPTGYRPLQSRFFSLPQSGGDSPVQAYITPAGDFTIPTFGVGTLIYLDGISFEIF